MTLTHFAAQLLALFFNPYFQLFMAVLAWFYAAMGLRAPEGTNQTLNSVSLTLFIFAAICWLISNWPATG